MTEEISIYKNEMAKKACLTIYEESLREWPAPYESILVKTRFGATHVLASGRKGKNPIVLLHGQWATATMWQPFIKRLGTDRMVYAVDQIDDVGKGHPTSMPSSREDYSAWLSDVFSGLDLDCADVAGLSYGGFLAVNFALAHPNAVSRLILLCPGLPNLGAPTGRWALHGMPVIVWPSRLSAEWLARGLTARTFQPNHPHVKQFMAGAIAVRKRIPFRPEIDNKEFATLKAPVLFLVGEYEALYPAHPAVEKARSLFPNIRSGVIPGASHMLVIDNPEAVVENMLEFLS